MYSSSSFSELSKNQADFNLNDDIPEEPKESQTTERSSCCGGADENDIENAMKDKMANPAPENNARRESVFLQYSICCESEKNAVSNYIDQLWGKYDVDNSNELDRDEFQSFMEDLIGL